jgi:hypothetical protein
MVMRKMVVSIISLTAFFFLGSVALSEQPHENPKASQGKVDSSKGGAPPKASAPAGAPSSLEELLAQAMQNNPDLRVAESKVHEAEAELNRIRFQVMQKVITLYHSVQAQKEVLKQVQTLVDTQKKRFESGRVAIEDLQSAATSLAQEKAKLANMEAELPAVLGKLPPAASQRSAAAEALRYLAAQNNTSLALQALAFSPDGKRLLYKDIWGHLPETLRQEMNQYLSVREDGQVVTWDPVTGRQLTVLSHSRLAPKSAVTGSMGEKIRKALETPIAVEYQDKPLADVLKDLQQKTPGVTFIARETTKWITQGNQSKPLLLTLRFAEPVPLSAVLEAIEDAGSLRVTVREYGFFVSHPIDPIPEGATPLHEFLKNRTGAAPAKAAGIEGKIKSIDASAGLVTITIGSDAGVFEGQILDVYRLKPEPRYLGKIKVVAVRRDQAVARPDASSGRVSVEVQVGDQVTGSQKSETP